MAFSASKEAYLVHSRWTPDYSFLLGLLLTIQLCISESLALIAFVADIVAVKDRARLVPADTHCHRFRHSRAHHVANGCPTKIVHDAASVLEFFVFPSRSTLFAFPFHVYGLSTFRAYHLSQPCQAARSRPRFPKLADRLAFSVEDISRQPHVIIYFELACPSAPRDQFTMTEMLFYPIAPGTKCVLINPRRLIIANQDMTQV